MDIHIIAAPSSTATTTALIAALQSQWPAARVRHLPTGLSVHRDPDHPPDLAIILHGPASTSTTADIATIRQLSTCPIVVIGPGIPEQAEIECLHHGADIVLARPLSTLRLLAIVESLLRRAGDDAQSKGQVRTVGDLTLDTDQHLLSIGNRRVSITPTEFHLLEALAARFGRSVPSSDLMHKVWGMQNEHVRRSLKVHISRLRHKLSEAGSTTTVDGSRGNGYTLAEREAE